MRGKPQKIPSQEEFDKLLFKAAFELGMPDPNQNPEETLDWLLKKQKERKLTIQEQALLEQLIKVFGGEKIQDTNYQNLKDELIADSNPSLPLSEINAETILKYLAPDGYKIKDVAGSGGEGGDAIFENSKKEIFKIEVKSIVGSMNSFNQLLSHAAQKQAPGNLIFIQVSEGTDVSKWMARFWGRRKDLINSSKPSNVYKMNIYKNTKVIIMDIKGNVLLPKQPIYNPN